MKLWKKQNNNSENNNSHFADNDSSRYYEALTPADDIENGQEYMAALDWALNQPAIHNIAISGPYGSGKSSVIESYLKKREGLKALRLSLADFNLQEELCDKTDESKEKELETGILKQLFYSVDSSRIPQSRYRKPQTEKRRNYIIAGLLTALILGSGYCITERARVEACPAVSFSR